MEWRNLTSALANGAWLRRRPRASADKLAPYFKHGFWGRHKFLTSLLIAFIAALYGLVFGVTTTAFLVQMMIPVALVVLLVLALLPENGVAFDRTVTWLLYSLVFALAVWPDYLAFAAGGLPWITAVRLIAIPLCLIYFISLSQSAAYRLELSHSLQAVPATWKLMALFFVLAFLSIGISEQIAESTNKFIVAIYAWGTMFLIAAQIFGRPGWARTFAQLLWVGSLIACAIALWELRLGQVPWAGHIPSFLKIEDETIAAILSGKQRAALGEHRLQGKFTTPLGLAEFLALIVPFIVHFLVTGRNLFERVAAIATLGLMLFVINKTDSRLGVIGFILAILGYLFYWALRRWRRREGSVFAPIVVLGYPAMLVVLLIASFFVTRIRNAVWGSGAYQASNDAREVQFSQGTDLIFRHPWGHGIGRAAETLGFTNLDGVLTIDSYFLSIGLEMGVVGFVAYYGAFVVAIWVGGKELVKAGDREETAWLAPTVLALGNFVVIKSILSQQENHPLAFLYLGMALALIALVRRFDPKPEISQPTV
jgi:hypothetical protein